MVEHVNVGVYTLKEGDTPRSVAEDVYSDGNLYTVLTKNNLESNWEPSEKIKVPNKKGRRTVVQDRESIKTLLQRMYPHDPPHIYYKKFYTWNGGVQVEDLVGSQVYVPER
jgi:hypothetical protein